MSARSAKHKGNISNRFEVEVHLKHSSWPLEPDKPVHIPSLSELGKMVDGQSRISWIEIRSSIHLSSVYKIQPADKLVYKTSLLFNGDEMSSQQKMCEYIYSCGISETHHSRS